MIEQVQAGSFDKDVYQFIKKMKSMSLCHKRKVVCVLTQANNMVAYGINRVISCDGGGGKCLDCYVTHAEVMAIDNANQNHVRLDKKWTIAYINHYPCRECQNLLRPYVNEIRLFPDYKDHCVPEYYVKKYGNTFNNILLMADYEV